VNSKQEEDFKIFQLKSDLSPREIAEFRVLNKDILDKYANKSEIEDDDVLKFMIVLAMNGSTVRLNKYVHSLLAACTVSKRKLIFLISMYNKYTGRNFHLSFVSFLLGKSTKQTKKVFGEKSDNENEKDNFVLSKLFTLNDKASSNETIRHNSERITRPGLRVRHDKIGQAIICNINANETSQKSLFFRIIVDLVRETLSRGCTASVADYESLITEMLVDRHDFTQFYAPSVAESIEMKDFQLTFLDYINSLYFYINLFDGKKNDQHGFEKIKAYLGMTKARLMFYTCNDKPKAIELMKDCVNLCVEETDLWMTLGKMQGIYVQEKIEKDINCLTQDQNVLKMIYEAITNFEKAQKYKKKMRNYDRLLLNGVAYFAECELRIKMLRSLKGFQDQQLEHVISNCGILEPQKSENRIYELLNEVEEKIQYSEIYIRSDVDAENKITTYLNDLHELKNFQMKNEKVAL
jgi:hypothetical protein